jgi:hypothetical protein
MLRVVLVDPGGHGPAGSGSGAVADDWYPADEPGWTMRPTATRRTRAAATSPTRSTPLPASWPSRGAATRTTPDKPDRPGPPKTPDRTSVVPPPSHSTSKGRCAGYEGKPTAPTSHPTRPDVTGRYTKLLRYGADPCDSRTTVGKAFRRLWCWIRLVGCGVRPRRRGGPVRRGARRPSGMPHRRSAARSQRRASRRSPRPLPSTTNH